MDIELIEASVSAAKHSRTESGKIPINVGAAIRLPSNEIVSAFRGEENAGDHAEFTLLEKKLRGQNLEGCVVASTLEPCTSRSAGKKPCCDRLIERGIKTVIIGTLDPNPDIYGVGYRRLKEHGVSIEFFPEAQRTRVIEDNRFFINTFFNNAALEGLAKFDYESNNNVFTLGSGDKQFVTEWSTARNGSIHCYNDKGTKIALALQYEIEQIESSSALDFSSRTRTPTEGEIIVGRNSNGFYVAMKIIKVRTRVPHEHSALLEFEYRISDHKEGDFRPSPEVPYELPSIDLPSLE